MFCLQKKKMSPQSIRCEICVTSAAKKVATVGGGVTQVHVRLFLSSELPLVKQWRRIQSLLQRLVITLIRTNPKYLTVSE